MTGRRVPTDQTHEDPWLTLAEVAADLRVNASTVRLWVSQGRLQASRVGQRKWLVRRSELGRVLASEPPGAARGQPDDVVRPPMPGDRLIIDPGSGEREWPDG